MQVFQLAVIQDINDKIEFILTRGGQPITRAEVDAMGFLKISKLDAQTVLHHFHFHGIPLHGSIDNKINSMIMEEPPVKSIKHVLEPLDVMVTPDNFIFRFRDIVTTKMIARGIPHGGKYYVGNVDYERFENELSSLYVLDKVNNFIKCINIRGQ